MRPKENPQDGSKKRSQGDSDASVGKTTCPDHSRSEDNTEIFIKRTQVIENLKHLKIPRGNLHNCGRISKIDW